MNKNYLIEHVSDYQRFVVDIAPLLNQGCLVLLEGDLGAGKTTLISHILRHFQIQMVASPTYAFHHRYESDSMIFDHFDLYRLESADEVESIGMWDLIQQNQVGAIFIEWPSRIADHDWPLDRKMIRIQLKIETNEKRNLYLKYEESF